MQRARLIVVTRVCDAVIHACDVGKGTCAWRGMMNVGSAQAVTTEVAEGVAAGVDHAVAEAALQRRPYHSRLDAMRAASSHVWHVLAFCIYSLGARIVSSVL